MGLISKTATVKWGTRNKKYYEAKGYLHTKIGDEFEVKVEHLSNGTDTYVEVECDCEDCKTPIDKTISWQQYKKCVKEDGKYYCVRCASNLYGHDKTKKTHLLNGKSFYDWCVEHGRYDVLALWDYELNGCSPKDVTYASEGFNKKGYWFKCPKGIHTSELKQINSFTKGREGSISCNKCNSFAQWGIDNICSDFLEKFWSKENTVNPWEISYGNNKIKIKIICQECKSHVDFFTTCNRFTNNTSKSYGCPLCAIINKTGKNSPKWRGGTTELNKYLRDEIEQWKEDSMKQCNYRCVLTGDKFNVVHHIYGFNEILKELFNILKLPIYNTMTKYSIDELKLIKKVCLELHYKYGLGVCLTKEVHDLFHQIYGNGNNTPEQFNEFKNNYNKGLYKKIR